MKYSKKIAIVAVLLQAYPCIASEYKHYEHYNYVQKQLSKQQEIPITFLWSIDDEIRDHFPQEKAQLDPSTYNAIKEISLQTRQNNKQK
jgi:hypothetical protein